MAAAGEPLISVVMPVRDGARWLADAIGSVRAQTLPAWELLVVDGASRDDSRAIAMACARQDPRIRVLSEPDRGMYDALLKGLEKTSAPLCCWLNADDRFLPHAFELVAWHARETGARWVTGLPAAMDAGGRLHTVDGVKWYPRALIRAGCFHGRFLGFIQQEGTFFARALLARLDPAALAEVRASRQAGDTILWRALARHAPLEVLPTVLGVFRTHPGNMTRDMATYDAELRAAGFPMPPRPLALLAKAVFVPATFLRHKRALRRWRALTARLPEPQRGAAEPAPRRRAS